MSVPTSRALVDDGSLAWWRAGRGIPVLFIQGVGAPGGGWRPQTDGLADRCDCVWFDNRGAGLSVPANRPISVEQMARDALAVMDAADWSTAHVVGHSLGGIVAQQVALETRGRVRSLSLLCTFPAGRFVAPLSARMAWLGMRTRVGTRRMRQRGFLRLVLPPAMTPDGAIAAEVSALFGHDLADQPPIAAEQLRALRAADLTSRLATLTGMPTLVVTATHDPIAPPSAGRALAEALPGARYVEVPDASHGLPITHAALTNRLLFEHIAAAERR
ncbi:MAG: alpha/beta fold hydrolase [Vicinamibacterales bacterium]